MCGIAGYVGPQPPDRDRIAACLTLMNRRGPDHADCAMFEQTPGRFVTLLHSRLSIIDLNARADQPFRAGAKTLIYNGELYNFIEVRDRLASDGVQFHTESDTEVLLAAIDVRTCTGPSYVKAGSSGATGSSASSAAFSASMTSRPAYCA